LSIRFEYETILVKGIPDEFLATKEKIEHHRVGPGDEVFMPGRFINHEGKQRNLPAVSVSSAGAIQSCLKGYTAADAPRDCYGAH
jgi:hypothetical protein